MNTPVANCMGTGRKWRDAPGRRPVCPFCRRGPKSLGMARTPRRLGDGYAGQVPPHQDLRVAPLAGLYPVTSDLAAGCTQAGEIVIVTTEGTSRVAVPDPRKLQLALDAATRQQRKIRYPSKETS
jgi:hypothetical protein